MRHKIPWKVEIIASVIVLPLVIWGVYLYKHSIASPMKVTHEHALPWAALEDSYKALNSKSEFLYGDSLQKLQEVEQKTVAMYGYMYPLKMAEKHTHFLLSKQPHICQFHLATHSVNMVEVMMKGSGIAFQRQPMLLTGTFSIPNDKELGVTFRLEEAERVND